MIRNFFVIVIFILAPISTSTPQKKWLVFWNVGQGSWTSYITDQYCLHIDSGGTRLPPHQHCKNKPNFLFLTHYDWDHIGFAQRLHRSLPLMCLWEEVPPNTPLKKKHFLKRIPLCQKQNLPALKRIYRSKFSKKNESHAYLLEGQFLITGDSDHQIEKKFSHLKELKAVRLVLAGHHGSRTSLSPKLLASMKSLEMILASCLKRRYGHPHKETLMKAKKFKKALFTTELYGSVAFELP